MADTKISVLDGASAGDHMTAPVVVDLGKVRSKRIKQLKRGTGPLTDEAMDVVRRVQEGMGGDAKGKQFVPVVIVYRKKEKKRKGWAGF